MDVWHEAVLNECMRTETCYVADDPEKTLSNLIQWHIELALENTVSVWDLAAVRNSINDILQGKK